MRYYVYVSDTKLDMLYPQIPAKLAARLAWELKLDLKLLGLTLRNNDNDATRYGKLHLVEEYIDQNYEVGWMSEPTSWFRGELPLRSGVFGPQQDDGLLLYGGIGDGLLIGLLGSARHRTGHSADPDQILVGFSALSALTDVLETERGGTPSSDPPPVGDMAHEAMELTRGLRGPAEPCEFLARRLLRTETVYEGAPLTVVLGTPLYVALMDR
jgi:hypothetical protein